MNAFKSFLLAAACLATIQNVAMANPALYGARFLFDYAGGKALDQFIDKRSGEFDVQQVRRHLEQLSKIDKKHSQELRSLAEKVDKCATREAVRQQFRNVLWQLNEGLASTADRVYHLEQTTLRLELEAKKSREAMETALAATRSQLRAADASLSGRITETEVRTKNSIKKNVDRIRINQGHIINLKAEKARRDSWDSVRDNRVNALKHQIARLRVELDSWLASHPRSSPSEQTKAVAFDGRDLIRNRKYARAILILQEAYNRDQNSPGVAYLLGFACSEVGQLDRAKRCYHEGVRRERIHGSEDWLRNPRTLEPLQGASRNLMEEIRFHPLSGVLAPGEFD